MRRALFFALAVWLAALQAAAPAAERRADKFIVITIETLRSDHLSCYGHDRPTTPNIDAFAGKAVRFELAFSAAPNTYPSVTAMLTSRFPGLNETLLANGWDWAAITTPTLATELEKAGFATGAIVGNLVLRKTTGLTPGFQTYEAKFDSKEINRSILERICTSLEPAAERWLERHKDEPFFLWLHFQDPHGPYAPPAPFDTKFGGGSAAAGKVLPVIEVDSGPGGIPAYQKLGDNRDLDHYLAQYDGEIAFLDDALGRLFGKLEALGLMEKTAIFLAGDHGEAFGERDHYCCHGHTVYPELTHVPLLFHMPGRAPAVSGTPVTLVDIAPTILNLAGVEAPTSFLGENLLDTLANGARKGPFFIETSRALAAVEGKYLFTWGNAGSPSGLPENHKVFEPQKVGFYQSPMNLYDIAADPTCQNDIKEAEPRWFRYLRGVCQEYLRISTRTRRQRAKPEIEAEVREALKALGYLNN